MANQTPAVVMDKFVLVLLPLVGLSRSPPANMTIVTLPQRHRFLEARYALLRIHLAGVRSQT